MGKSSSANDAAGRAAEAQTRLARQLVNESSPLRRMLIQDAQQFTSGGRDVTGLPEFGAFKTTLEDQVQRARDQIIAGTPEGGALSSALADVELGRAQSLADAAGQLSAIETDRGIQLATFGAAQGSQGLGSAAATQAQRASAEAVQNAGKAQGLGQLAGAGLGFKAAG